MTSHCYSVVYKGQTVEFTSDEVRNMLEHETQRKFDRSERREWLRRIDTWMSIRSNQPNIAMRILKWREETAPPAEPRERKETLDEQLG